MKFDKDKRMVFFVSDLNVRSEVVYHHIFEQAQQGMYRA